MNTESTLLAISTPARETKAISPARFMQMARAWCRRAVGLRLGTPRHLRLSENLSLGEHRFVAVVEFEHARFLLGGTSSSLTLLARLADVPEPTGKTDGVLEEAR